MNYFYLTAGILSLLATIGHFAMGTKDFLKPVLTSDIETIPKKVMHSLFHYMSVFLILTTIIMLMFSFGKPLVFQNTSDVSIFIGGSFTGFALVQLIIAVTSSLERGVLKLFQWVFWLLIALFAFWGSF